MAVDADQEHTHGKMEERLLAFGSTGICMDACTIHGRMVQHSMGQLKWEKKM